MTASLRTAALQGGALVAARQAASLVFGLLGTIALTKLLGPSGYGRFAAALALYTYAFSVAPLGVNAWLLRRAAKAAGAAGAAGTAATAGTAGTVGTDASDAGDADPSDPAVTPRHVADTARALLLLSAVGVGALVALALPLVERWLDAPNVRPLALAMLAALPLQLLNLVPLAVLERALNYRAVAAAELQGLVLYYVIAVGLAWWGWGPEAIVLGWWIQNLWIGLRVHLAARMPLTFAWDRGLVREALDYGLRYASSLWTYQLRDLVNPLIVGKWAGVEGVAIVALSVRLVEAASFVKVAVWRLALPALARLQHDTARLAQAVRSGMRLQLVIVGPALVLLAVVGIPVAAWLFGPQWHDLRSVMALIAAGTLCNAAFNLHSSALYALGRPGAVWQFHVVHVLLFAGAAALLVPRVGLAGYALAELIAFPSYVVVWRAFAAGVGREAAGQGTELLLAAGLVTATAVAWQTPWGGLIALLPLLSPGVRAIVAESVQTVRSLVLARVGAAAGASAGASAGQSASGGTR